MHLRISQERDFRFENYSTDYISLSSPKIFNKSVYIRIVPHNLKIVKI